MAIVVSGQQSWTFKQEGPNPKTLQLTGWSMPFGRPRQGPIVDRGIQIRRSITYIAGKGVEPIINSMGSSPPPWVLHGRWMDQGGGFAGYCQQTIRNWNDFISDERPVIASWASVLGYRVFIHQLKAEMESQAECAWTLYADALSDLSVAPSIGPDVVNAPFDLAAQMRAAMPKATLQKPGGGFLDTLSGALAMLPEIATQLALLVSAINTPFLIVYSTASQMADFVTSVSTDLSRLAGGISAVQAGLLEFQAATDLLCARMASLQTQYSTQPVLGAQPLFSAGDVVNMTAAKIDADIASQAILAVMADMQAQIDTIVRGNPTTIVTAQTGDTWESIAARTLGSVDAAQTIRDLNNVLGGAKPVPGRKYQVPSV